VLYFQQLKPIAFHLLSLSTRFYRSYCLSPLPPYSVNYFARGSGCEVLWWVCLSMYLCVRLSVWLDISWSHVRSLPMFCACCLCP